MAELNFPKDRTELNPPGTGSLQTGDEYTASGTTWVYDATAGAWGSGGGTSSSTIYLSKINDDTAAGAITFQGQTTHEGGVSVTGGDSATVVNGIVRNPTNNGIQHVADSKNVTQFTQNGIGLGNTGGSNTDVNILNNHVKTNKNGLLVTKEGNGDGTEINVVYLQPAPDDGATASIYGVRVQPTNGHAGRTVNGDVYGLHASNNLGRYIGSGTTFGVHSGIQQSGSRTNFNFYAEGDAPNYFTGLTEHASGVSVMGGNKTTVPLGISSDGNGFVSLNAQGNQVLLASPYQCTRNIDEHSGLTGPSWYGFDVRGVPRLATTAALNVRFFTSTGPVEDVIGLHVQGDYTGNVTKKVAGVLSGVTDSAVTSGGGYSFNFLAEGNAPNHFAGAVRFYPYSDDAYNPSGPINRSLDGVVIDHRDSIHIHACKSTNDDVPAMRINRSGTSSNRRLMDFTAGSGSTVGGITTDGATITIFNMTSDYRIKTNIQELTNATQKIQALNPVSFEYTDRNPGVSYQGFVAHELAEVCPKAVVGTKDATEVIGTLTDVDGNVETEVTEPEAIPFGATWEQTGTRDVLQGVDQTKLIPLLTKALQEALDKIETLETRLSDAGIA